MIPSIAIELVSIGSFVLCVLLFVAYLRARARADRVLRTLSTHKIDPLALDVPELIAHEAPPILYRVGGKALWLQSLTIKTMDKFTREWIAFFHRWRLQLDGLKILDLPELIDAVESEKQQEQLTEDVDDILTETLRIFRQKSIRKNIERIICKTVLRDPIANPEKMTKREFIKNRTVLDLVLLFWSYYQFNNGYCLKKKLDDLLEIVLRSSTNSGTAWRHPFQNSAYSPRILSINHYQGYEFWQKGKAKSKNGEQTRPSLSEKAKANFEVA